MLEKFPVYMTAFKQERMIRVYLPESYNNENKRYPVLYMHDGQNVFENEGAIKGISLGMKDYLDENGLEIIVVGIDQNPEGEERVNEYCPWVNGEISKQILGYVSPSGGRGEEYLDFLVNELKPFIDQKYRTLKNHTSMAGISLGSLISTYAACRYPSIFKRIAAISPGFYRNQEEIENLLRASDLSAIEKFYMDFGTKEVGEDDEMNKVFLDLTNRVVDILNCEKANLHFQLIEDAEHAYLFFRKRVPAILSYLFSDIDMKSEVAL
ncbi:alpha/beta hydrolase-fold protein [Neobacillus novalis]|uniref:Alpha/beta hydrolase-fold protein n=1 Tax=Neobacillus novalis TaxID=220687 RepID=A0AA95MHN9_9BACI|nr:alpha/beta hydrolase-fold protein [Neobacillus novalis]WHY83899.1 alpha/beta hydrolase-fold protein [Neobacillus novalis]